MEDLTLALRGKDIGPEVRDGPVDIPFDIVNIGAVQDPVDGPDQVVLDLSSAHVQDQLVAASDGVAAGDLHDPVGMGPEEIRILGDHLGLEPDAEFQSYVVDLPDQLCQAAADLLLVDVPVAQARVIVIPLAEPAVVHNDHLDPHVLCGSGDLHQLDVVEGEKGGFPGVDQNGTSDIPDKSAPVHVGAEEVVVVLAHPGQALVGIGHEDRRSFKIISRGHLPGKEPVVDTHDQAGLVILVQLRLRQKAARIHKGKTVAGTVILGSVSFRQGDKGILLMGGNAPSAADLVDVVGQALPLHLALLAVAAGKGDQVQIPAVHKVHVHGHDPLESDGLCASVMDSGGAHDDIGLLKDRIQESDPDLCHGVLQRKLQGICGIFLPGKGGGKAFQREGALADLMRDIPSVKGKAAVSVLYLDGIDAEISLLLGGEFLGLGIQGEGPLFQGIVGIARKAAVIATDQIAQVLIVDGGPVIEVLHVIQISYLQLIGRPGRMQGKRFFLLVVYDRHGISSPDKKTSGMHHIYYKAGRLCLLWNNVPFSFPSFVSFFHAPLSGSCSPYSK